MKKTKYRSWLSLCVLMVAGMIGYSSVVTADTIWVEAENSVSGNFDKFETTSMGKDSLLSGGKWIMKGVEAEEVAAMVPEEGVILKYQVKAEKAGNYTFWMRVGWWKSRADLQWRLGDGEWYDFKHDALTINLMALAFFTEASWGNLGEVSLPKGNTTLEIKWPKVTDGKLRMLMAMDCFAFVQGPFTPEGKFKPGSAGYTNELTKVAARQLFKLATPTSATRTEVELSGAWQVARYDDPDMKKDTYVPIKALPTPVEYDLKWMGFNVPGNPWKVEPLVFGHRLLYRTRVDVPAETNNHGFKLHFAGTHWIVSVFINGKLAGTHKGVWVPWNLDVSSFIKPGQINEITIAVKGAYYARDPINGDIDRGRNLPLSRIRLGKWVTTIYPSTKGDGDGTIYGIVNPVTLICTGSAYTDDVFIKPSVERKELLTEVTVRNTGKNAGKFEVVCEAVNDKNGEVEKSFGPVSVNIPAMGSQTVEVKGTWNNPKLWWPQPNAQLYRLRTTVSSNGKALDVQEELFGFREVTIEGTGVYINGVRRNFWNWVDVSGAVSTPAEWIKKWRTEKNRFIRFGADLSISKLIPSREDRLEFYDREGVAGRLCTMIDGMFFTKNLMMKNPDGGEPERVLHKVLWENFNEHMAQVAKAYRNHPSVIEYQTENELVYITGMNVNGSWLNEIEEAMSKVCDAGRAYDNTRPYTVGGAGDLSGKLEINEPHYPTAAEDFYPQNAYDTQHYAKKIERWPWDRKKPWQVGEDSFAQPYKLGAIVSGSKVFRSKHNAREGKARYLRMLYSGYRWQGVNAFFPWDNLADFEDSEKVFSDLAVLSRKQSHRLYGGKSNMLLFKVMNDTFSEDPITFKWSYEIDGKQITGKQVDLTIEPGFGQEQTIIIDAPSVKKRKEGLLRFILMQNGEVGYEDTLFIPVLPSISKIKIKKPVLVFDRQGALTKYLTEKCKFESITNLSVLPQKKGLLLIGHNTLTPAEAFGGDLLKFAANGNGVICLEQEHPMTGTALPTKIKTTTHMAGYVHPQALGTPLFNDLGKDDLIDWMGNHPTAINLYLKPNSGARTLAEAGSSLNLTPLLEVPCGKGVILLCQLRVSEKLSVDPAADLLLRNMISVYGNYVPTTGKVALFADSNPLFRDSVIETGVMVEKPVSLNVALNEKAFKVVALDSTPEVLGALLTQKEQVEEFTKQGGWILLNGLTPDGMTNFNSLVGGEYILRPFRLERLTLDRPDHPLVATLGARDIALNSPDRIMHSTFWVSPNTYSSVIDAPIDFAPFTLPPGAPADPFVYKPTRDDHDPYNYVNGMSREDAWRYTRQIWISEKYPAPDITFQLRRPDTIEAIEIGNLITYGAITEAKIIIDGNENAVQKIKLPASTQVALVKFSKTIHVEKSITIRPTKWFFQGRVDGDGKELSLVGVNNIRFLRPTAKSPGIVLDNIGGLVVFPHGKGGIVLCQLKFMKEEPKEANAATKARLLSTLLQNMGVGFSSSQEVAVPGVNVRFSPINLQEYGTAYMDAKRGSPVWLGYDKKDTAQLPVGDGNFADVTYHITDYATAPTPDVIVLGGAGMKQQWTPRDLRKVPSQIKGIKVGEKSDLLYFLHAVNVTRPITTYERAQIGDSRRPFVMPIILTYVLNYVDGSTKRIPVVLEHGFDNWLQQGEDVIRVDEAQIGWSHSLPDTNGERGVIYSMQVPNPLPDVEIKTIDVIRSSGRGVPAVLGITLGNIIK